MEEHNITLVSISRNVLFKALLAEEIKLVKDVVNLETCHAICIGLGRAWIYNSMFQDENKTCQCIDFPDDLKHFCSPISEEDGSGLVQNDNVIVYIDRSLLQSSACDSK